METEGAKFGALLGLTTLPGTEGTEKEMGDRGDGASEALGSGPSPGTTMGGHSFDNASPSLTPGRARASRLRLPQRAETFALSP